MRRPHLFEGYVHSMKTFSAKSMFATWSRERLLLEARPYPSRAAFLRSLGFSERFVYGLYLLMSREGLTVSDLWPNAFSKLNRPREHYELDLTNDLYAYFYGLALADGSIREDPKRRSGAIAIELKESDAAVLHELSYQLPWKCNLSRRQRVSAFSGAPHNSVSLVCHTHDLRSQMVAAGFPIGAKSHICSPPNVGYDRAAFWRGYLDGDGSMGVTATGLPFVSLVTVSQSMCEAYLSFLNAVCGFTPKVNKNTRDNAWNIMITRKRAVDVLAATYADATIALPRKLDIAMGIIGRGWNHPKKSKFLHSQGSLELAA
jgi:hypothetical protein